MVVAARQPSSIAGILSPLLIQRRQVVLDRLRRLARWRVPLGYALGGVALWLAEPTRQSLAIGAAVGAAGEALRIWAAGHLEKGREVTNTGPYAITRHPLYAGSTIMGAGLAIAANSVAVAVLVLLPVVYADWWGDYWRNYRMPPELAAGVACATVTWVGMATGSSSPVT